jgi:elongation factor G
LLPLEVSLAHAEWQPTKINIIDTPSVANFLSDARSALRVVECALVVLDVVAGVEVQTEKLWSEARKIVSTQLPIGEEKHWTGVVDLVGMRPLTFVTDGSGTTTHTEVPASLVEQETETRERLIEMVAEGGERLMETCFSREHVDAAAALNGPARRHRRGPPVSVGLLLRLTGRPDPALARRRRALRAFTRGRNRRRSSLRQKPRVDTRPTTRSKEVSGAWRYKEKASPRLALA